MKLAKQITERTVFICLTKSALLEYWKLERHYPEITTIDLYNGFLVRLDSEQPKPSLN
jgi:hypothetical protein